MLPSSSPLNPQQHIKLATNILKAAQEDISSSSLSLALTFQKQINPDSQQRTQCPHRQAHAVSYAVSKADTAGSEHHRCLSLHSNRGEARRDPVHT